MKGSVEDRLEIRELVERYASSAIQTDVEKWSQVWAEDGSFQLSSMKEPVHGKETIVATFAKALEYVDYLSLMCFPAELEFDGDTARGSVFTHEVVHPKTGGSITVVGQFHDEYVRQSGRWLLQSRRYEALGKDIKSH